MFRMPSTVAQQLTHV